MIAVEQRQLPHLLFHFDYYDLCQCFTSLSSSFTHHVTTLPIEALKATNVTAL